jgi:hypothetical protein
MYVEPTGKLLPAKPKFYLETTNLTTVSIKLCFHNCRFIDGCTYFSAVAEALESAKEEIGRQFSSISLFQCI